MRSATQIKIGALISYAAIGFNIIAGLIYTPWMIDQIGQSNYGLYTLATSVITLFVMDFGMGSAVARFISKFRAENSQENINNFLGIVYKLYLLVDVVICFVLIAVFFLLDTIYSNLSASELQTFKILYIIVAIFSVISFPFTNLNGILTAYEKFVQLKLCDLAHKVFIIAAMVFALAMGCGVYALVTVNAIAGLLVIVVKLFVIKRNTGVRVNFGYRNKTIIKEIFSFSIWTTVASIMQRLVFNITPSIIAAVSVTGAIGVSVFGLASTIEGYVYTIATAISGMFMPRISRIVFGGQKETELMPLMIRIGRIQVMIVGLLTVGFIALGKSFVVNIWDKPDFIESYYCAVALILPSLFYLPMQIANTTLIVENKVKLQAYVFIAMGTINVLSSFILSRFWGAIGASISILIAYMIRTALMAYIYQKKLHLDMRLFAESTFLKLMPQLIITLLISLFAEYFNPIHNVYIRFLVNGIIVVLTYFVLMWNRGFDSYEKGMLTQAFEVIKKISGFGKTKL